jgi:hypothetical protein
MNRTIIIVAASVLFAAGAQAQFDSDSATANAGANIVAPIAITATAQLHFGDIVASAASGTVELTPGGDRTGTDVTLGNGAGVSVASFDVDGDPDGTFAITLPVSSTISNGTETMTINGYTSVPAATGTLNGTGEATIAVGATLQVGASQASGTYTGTFDVTVAYN